jgi:uncharacterized protein with HEPN domain
MVSMEPADRVRLQHMLEHGKEAIAVAAGLTREEPGRNRVVNLALVRLLEIVGEAAARPRGRPGAMTQRE